MLATDSETEYASAGLKFQANVFSFQPNNYTLAIACSIFWPITSTRTRA
jgi:hypothetical protein